MAAIGVGTMALNFLSVISGGLGILQFGMDNFKEPEEVGSVLTVQVALDYKTDHSSLSNAGGDLPDVRLWNQAGEFLGMKADPGDVDSGESGEIKVPHYEKDSRQQAPYALFSANDNAICIAYTTITWPDGNKYAWDGNWGAKCGGNWFYSNIFIKGTNVKPKCLWIDGNGDKPHTGFQLHWPDYVSETGEAPEGKEADKMIKDICGDKNEGTISFKLYTDDDPNSIRYRPIQNSKLRRYMNEQGNALTKIATSPKKANKKPINGTQIDLHPNKTGNSTSPKSQDAKKKKNPHDNKLIITNKKEHSVDELCKSETSKGPDLANTAEGKFCRMKDKTIWPICSSTQKNKCFNTKSKQLEIGGKSTREVSYDAVGDWST